MSLQPAARAQLYCAIDRAEIDKALALAQTVAQDVDGLKLGLEFFLAQGRAGVERLASLGLPLFLDLKLHDIPNTVGSAVASLRGLDLAYVTVHASGGSAMIEAAVSAAKSLPQAPIILAVTVLTSLGRDDLAYIGVTDAPERQVDRLAGLAMSAGAGGLVCSPLEVARLRRLAGPDVRLVVPGIRPAGASAGDQKRIMSPSDAQAAGADILVVGRPISAEADPGRAAASLRRQLEAA
ncbi:MAG: orotidine-5'-phosphate decarboxylase [Geminicoccaceae bacterium]